MKAASDTKTRIIDKASELMMQRGINGFSYRDISGPLGVKNAAIHYHFPSKHDLVHALIRDQHDLLRRSTSEFMAYGGNATQQIEGLFQFTLTQCRGGRPVCVVGGLAADYDELPDEIKHTHNQLIQDYRKWLVRVLELGREQGEFDFRGDPEDKALTMFAAIQGGRQLYRVHGEAYLLKLFAQIRRELGMKT